MVKTQIERFFLYGEPPRPAGDRFVHLEFLDDRSRPANWIIRTHAHIDLHHVFVLHSGGGTAEADAQRIAFGAPCIVVVPAGVVHGFAWEENSAGRVLTFSTSFLASIAQRDPALMTCFGEGLWSAPADAFAWTGLLDGLSRELAWAAPSHGLAVEAFLSSALVQVLRLHHDANVTAAAPAGPQALLVARFRECVEQNFRVQPSVESMARSLGVSTSTLRAACQTCAGVSPAMILHDRILLEARRLMRYSNMSIGQIALYLGFSDAAYFSRFFSREAGVSPRAFKQSGAAEAGPGVT